MSNQSSAVVTGIGLVTPLGLSSQETVRKTLLGESGIDRLTLFDPQGHACTAGAQVEEFDLAPSLQNPKNIKFMNRSVQFAIRAAQEAFSSARIDPAHFAPDRIAVYVGSGSTGLEYTEFFRALDLAWEGKEDLDYKYLGGRPSRLIERYFSLRTLSNSGLSFLSNEFGAHGPSNNFVQNDTASALAIDAAIHDLLENRCDLALAGGYDSLLGVSTYLAFEDVALLSPSPPASAGRPFDRNRDGLVLGEGAGFLILERAAEATLRRAPVRGQIVDFCFGQAGSERKPLDLHDFPASRVIQEVLGEGVDMVLARGIGTQEADRREADTLASLIPAGTPVTALKGGLGYLGAATTAVELGITLLCLREGQIPPISNHLSDDPDIQLKLVTNRPQVLSCQSASALGITCSWSGQAAAWKVRSQPTTDR